MKFDSSSFRVNTDKIKGAELKVMPIDVDGEPLNGAEWKTIGSITSPIEMTFTQTDVDPEMMKLLFNLDDDMKPIKPVLTEKDIQAAKHALAVGDAYVEKYGVRQFLLMLLTGYSPEQIEEMGVLSDVADA